MFDQSLSILGSHLRIDPKDHDAKRVRQILPPQTQKRRDHLGNEHNQEAHHQHHDRESYQRIKLFEHGGIVFLVSALADGHEDYKANVRALR
jgi:hypothetical protein